MITPWIEHGTFSVSRRRATAAPRDLKIWGHQGIEPWTSETQTLNHTTRPMPRRGFLFLFFATLFSKKRFLKVFFATLFSKKRFLNVFFATLFSKKRFRPRAWASGSGGSGSAGG